MPDIEPATRAARIRLQHVDRRGQELADSVGAWTASEPIEVKVTIAEDRLSWEGVWQVSTPPFEEWALILGDAVHHLRAMLDNVVYFIAQSENATPKELRSVQFPIVSDPATWVDSRNRIEALPERVRSAIEAVQPFQRPESERASDGLAILASLNNADKHRFILFGLIQAHEVGHEFSVTIEGNSPTPVDPTRTEFYTNIVDGAVAIRQDTTPDRIADVRGGVNLTARVVVVEDGGKRWGITSGLAALATYVPTVIDEILSAWNKGDETLVGPAARKPIERNSKGRTFRAAG